jgi:hypothetical protein
VAGTNHPPRQGDSLVGKNIQPAAFGRRLKSEDIRKMYSVVKLPWFVVKSLALNVWSAARRQLNFDEEWDLCQRFVPPSLPQ